MYGSWLAQQQTGLQPCLRPTGHANSSQGTPARSVCPAASPLPHPAAPPPPPGCPAGRHWGWCQPPGSAAAASAPGRGPGHHSGRGCPRCSCCQHQGHHTLLQPAAIPHLVTWPPGRQVVPWACVHMHASSPEPLAACFWPDGHLVCLRREQHMCCHVLWPWCCRAERGTEQHTWPRPDVGTPCCSSCCCWRLATAVHLEASMFWYNSSTNSCARI
jgi:hypothetical protein